MGLTDHDWFTLLATTPGVDEVNFWQPSPSGGFAALEPGAPFLFKLHRSAAGGRDVIAGGGFFAHHTVLPSSVAWDSFGIKNGASTLSEMRRRIEKYRRVAATPFADYAIGCIMLAEPFFLPPEAWIDLPDWHANIVRGKTYDLTVEPGRTIWTQVLTVLRAMELQPMPAAIVGEERYVEVLRRQRIGQGTFRGLVTDAYYRKCAVTESKALPVLEAAHIVPFAEGGDHDVRNGLLLRSDVHKLFDLGYVTVTTDFRFEVSHRLRVDYQNGEEYLAMKGRQLWLPPDTDSRPNPSHLAWHNDNKFVA